MTTRVDVNPPIRVGDKIVQVGPLDWSGFKALVEALAQADLPLPSLNGDALRQKLAEVQAKAKASGTLALVDVAAIVYEFAAGNLPILYQWILKHPPLLTALLRGASNLSEEEIAGLTAGEVLRMSRAAYSALVNDGVFAEAACFFGEVVGLRPPAAAASGPTSAPPNAADSASESKSSSPPQPAGA
ncbi:MAG TPA: hypothetical protein VFI31_18585 [Pirellulales bacterium]|nr:hypothetical protein [Pirellulales bacterium]